MSISTKIGSYIARELNYSKEKEEIMVYALESIVLAILGFVLVMVVGFLLGAPKVVFMTALAGIILRKFSGGAHFRSPYLCLTVGAVVYPLGGWTISQYYDLWVQSYYFNWILILFFFLIFLIVYRYSPVDSEAKPIISPSFRKRLHRASLVTVVICSSVTFILESALGTAILGGLFLQALTLLPILNTKRR